ncbi:HAMP domain-containing sensor histidine kinase [Virgibacillus necropolis]|uniref:Signal transduction histidine-protein kinase ArlS n=1 Tax=Virgibacillus necropolis TaxID=163877 RepID=A0A221MHH1_9BACI|nr:HAMP domain-containing histidine kinase [Virgibacillus necropolis]ASN07113.1 two-component sensor histidine kinase [Virgibacillus necropolis]
MKLRTKIQLFSSLFMLVLILLVNASIYYFFYKLSADSELDQLDAHTETIISTLNENPTISKNQLLRAYLPNEGMIRVVDEKENKLVTLTKHGSYTSLPITFSASEIQEIRSVDDRASVAVVTQPVIWSDGNVVTLQVSKHLTGLDATMQTLLYVVIGASIVMLLPTIFAGRLLTGFILKPIQALIQTMNANKNENTWEKISVRSHSKDELYQMEQTFNEMIDHLRESFNKQEQFVSDASHELKTPIAIVKSYAQLLERRGLERPEIFQESIGAIETEADRMQKLVEQLLFLAKSKNESVLTEVNIVKLCLDVVTVFNGAYNRSIRVNRKEQEEILVKANKDQLKQVVYSLIDNACKYSEAEIIVTISVVDKNVAIAIQDFGPGISKEEQAKIFDRFYRVDKARNRDNGGTGLGLSIAKSIVEAHKGKLTVSSNIAEGSTFTVILPIVIDH